MRPAYRIRARLETLLPALGGTGRKISDLRDFLFDAQLSLLQRVDHRLVGCRAVEFFADPAFQPLVLCLKGSDVRGFHSVLLIIRRDYSTPWRDSGPRLTAAAWARDCHQNTSLVDRQMRARRSVTRMTASGCLERFGGEVNEEEQRRRLAILRTEHRDLDAAIMALTATDSQDQLQIARLKKRKLRLRDQIAAIEDYLTPDIIA
jgi:hypothetical protein